MKTIIEYIEKAKEHSCIRTDADLDYKLGLKKGSIYNWRNGRSWPEDETMVKLGELAGISKEQSVLELSYWRASGEAKSTYKKLLDKVVSAACIILVAGFVFLASTPAEAGALNSPADCQKYILSN